MGFREQLTQFDRTKVQPSIGLRNAIGLAIPLTYSLAVGQPLYGFLGSLGAMNAALSDGSDPYVPRGRRMLAASLLSAVAVGTGAASGHHPMTAGALIILWAIGAGLLVALDQTAADIGLLSLVMVLVFVGQPMTPDRAVLAGGVAFAGGVLQTVLSVALWPLRPYDPERRVIAALYTEIAAAASSSFSRSEAPRATAEANEAQAVVRSLARTHTVQAERYVSLVSQAERIRLSVLAIRRAPYLPQVAEILKAVAATLRGEQSPVSQEWFEAVEHPALAGQLRAAWDLANSSTSAGRAAFEQRQAAQPWRLRAQSTFAILRANFTIRSSAMRHALRLTLAVGTGEVLAHAIGGTRSYWLPMTAAIVLKPDFTATFSRGVLRIAGTFVGLAAATALFYLVTPTAALEVLLVLVIVFIFRCYGPANYGILTASLTAYIVVIFALAGQRPSEVIQERALHTVLGGLLALLIYGVWPTWERTQIGVVLARLLDAYRLYFRAMHDRSPELEQLRLEARLARSNAEAAMDRFVTEPKADPAVAPVLSKVMASSHRMVYAIIAVEARREAPSPLFVSFAHKVEITLHSLAAALATEASVPSSLPDLRAAQRELEGAGDSMSGEADRLANSVNTLSEHVLTLLDLSRRGQLPR